MIALANRLGTPVFLFDDTYIEEVILQVTDLIRGKRHFSGFEQDVDALMRGDLTEEQRRGSARGEIDPVGHGRLSDATPSARKERVADRWTTRSTRCSRRTRTRRGAARSSSGGG